VAIIIWPDHLGLDTTRRNQIFNGAADDGSARTAKSEFCDGEEQ
jgi:hypothetical protein